MVKGGTGAGGAERQFFLFGRGLAAKGWQVSFITHKSSHEFNGLNTAFPVYLADFSYLGGSKSQALMNWLSLLLAMRRANANYYVIKVPGHLLPIMAVYCKAYKRRLVFWAQMTHDANPKERTTGQFVGFLQDVGIRLVDTIVAQSIDQQYAFAKNYGREAHLVRSICDRIAPEEAKECAPWVDVLWVGNCHAKKRPEVMFEIARLLPDVQFAMAMNNSNRVRFEQFQKETEKIPNLRFLGQVPPIEMEQWFSHTRLFLNTSIREGFPNTFLQAWMNGVPVVSLGIDPDNLIKKNHLGLVVSPHEKVSSIDNPHALAQCLISPIKSLLSSESKRSQMGAWARKHVQDNHSPEIVVSQLIEVFGRVDGVKQ